MCPSLWATGTWDGMETARANTLLQKLLFKCRMDFFFFMVFLMLLTFGGGIKYTFIVHKSFVILTCTCKSSVKLEFIFIMESEIVLFNLPL